MVGPRLRQFWDKQGWSKVEAGSRHERSTSHVWGKDKNCITRYVVVINLAKVLLKPCPDHAMCACLKVNLRTMSQPCPKVSPTTPGNYRFVPRPCPNYAPTTRQLINKMPPIVPETGPQSPQRDPTNRNWRKFGVLDFNCRHITCIYTRCPNICLLV